MSKFLISLAAMVFAATSINAADYNYIDPGDYYWINDWGSENRRVVVVRKLGGGNVKVQDLSTGESSNVQASRLLTQSKLQAEEIGNAVVGSAVGVAIFVCLLWPCTHEGGQERPHFMRAAFFA